MCSEVAIYEFNVACLDSETPRSFLKAALGGIDKPGNAAWKDDEAVLEKEELSRLNQASGTPSADLL